MRCQIYGGEHLRNFLNVFNVLIEKVFVCEKNLHLNYFYLF